MCSNCGASGPRVERRRKVYSDWEPRDGKPKADAWRDVYAGLKWLAVQKRFKPKYPDAKFKHIFGCWPPDEIVEVAPYAPTAELLHWLARSNEQWKRLKRQEEATAGSRPAVAVALQSHASVPSEGYEPSFMTADDWNVKLG